MRYRIVGDDYAGREVQFWSKHGWEQCVSAGHIHNCNSLGVNTFNSHMSAVIFMAIHDMNCNRTIICEQLDEVVEAFKSQIS